MYNPGRNTESSLIFNNYYAFAFLTLNFPCTSTGSSATQHRFFSYTTPLLIGLNGDILRIWLVSVIQITSLMSNYISIAIDRYSSWIPWTDTFQVINYNCKLIIFQNTSKFCGLKKVHPAQMWKFAIKIKSNRYRYNISLSGPSCCLETAKDILARPCSDTLFPFG